MAVVMLDAKGLRCPQPTIQMTIMALKLRKGDILEVAPDEVKANAPFSRETINI